MGELQGQRVLAVQQVALLDSPPLVGVFPDLPIRIFYTTDGGASLVVSSPYSAAAQAYSAIAMRNTSGGVIVGVAGDAHRGLHYCSGSGCW